VIGAEVGVSGPAAIVVVAAPASFGKPETLSITDHLFTGIDIVASVVEAEAAPVPGSFGVILELLIEARLSGRAYTTARIDSEHAFGVCARLDRSYFLPS